MEERRVKPGSDVFCNGYCFLLATQVCDHLDSGLKREHRVSRKLESHLLKRKAERGVAMPRLCIWQRRRPEGMQSRRGQLRAEGACVFCNPRGQSWGPEGNPRETESPHCPVVEKIAS